MKVEHKDLLDSLFGNKKEYSHFMHGLNIDVIQPLADLGYINISSKENEIVSFKELQRGLEEFRIDSGLTKPNSYVYKEYSDKDAIINSISPSETRFLHNLLDLDGGYKIKLSSIEKGNIIPLRVLRYRLELLGIKYNKDFSNVKILESVFRFGRLIRVKSVQKTIDLLGDINRLVEYVLSTETFPRMVYFSSKKSINPYLYSIIRRKESINEATLNSILLQKENELNKILIRVMQTILWKNGNYAGRVDGDIGEVTSKSIKGLEDFFEIFEKDHDVKKDLNIEKLFTRFSNRIWGVEIIVILNSITVFISRCKIEGRNSTNEYLELESTIKEKFGETKVREFRKRLNSKWENANKDVYSNLSSKKYFMRRVYLSGKIVMLNIWRKLREYFIRIKKIATKVFDFLSSAVQSLYRQIREGLRIFASGLYFLLGKRTLVSGIDGHRSIMSKCDLDFDIVTYIPINISSDDLSKHCECLRTSYNDIKITLYFSSVLIEWILAAATGNMFIIFLKIGEVYRNLKYPFFT